MSRSHTFSNMTIFRPGALSRVTASPLTPANLSSNGIVALIGEADTGQPNVVTVIDDPSLAKFVYGSGALPDAIRIAFEPTTDPRMSRGAFRVLAYKTNQSTQATLQVPGAVSSSPSGAGSDDTTTGGTTAGSITLTTGGLTTSAMVGRWVKISGEIRRITANTATVLTLEKPLNTAPTNGTTVQFLNTDMILTSIGYGLVQNQLSFAYAAGTTNTLSNVITLSNGISTEISPEIGGVSFMNVEFLGGPITTTAVVKGLASSPAAPADPTISVITVLKSGVTLNAWQNFTFILADGVTRRKIASNSASDGNNYVNITLASGHFLSTSQIPAIESTITINGTTAATASIAGANGVATTLTTTVTSTPVSTADNLTFTFAAGETLTQFMTRVNTTSNFKVTVPNLVSFTPGINADTILMKNFGFGANNTNVDIAYDSGITPPGTQPVEGGFTMDLQEAINWVNNYSQLATAVRGTTFSRDGQQRPSNASTTYFTGGARGISSNSNWQAGFDLLAQNRLNHIVPLISQDLTNEGKSSTATFASVAAQLNSFLATANGVGKNECAGYLGMKGTKTQLINQAVTQNNTDCQVSGQALTVLDVSGTLTAQPEWSSAVTAAGMRAGASKIGQALTFKTLKTVSVTQDASWSPKSTTDINALIDAGVLYIEQNPQNSTYRWVRDITTYQKDDSLFYFEANVRDEIRAVVYNLRTDIENEFTGEDALPATIANVREFAAERLGAMNRAGWISATLDEVGGLVAEGWRKLRVFFSGNTLTLRVEVCPTGSITFTDIDIFTMVPTIAV